MSTDRQRHLPYTAPFVYQPGPKRQHAEARCSGTLEHPPRHGGRTYHKRHPWLRIIGQP